MLKFRPGDIIQQAHRYTLRVQQILDETDDKITFRVLHAPEEDEYWDDNSTHVEVFRKSDLLELPSKMGMKDCVDYCKYTEVPAIIK